MTPLVAVFLFTWIGVADTPPVAQARLTLVPDGVKALKVGYFPVQIPLSKERPAGVKKEPVYAATPKYGLLRIGDGPRAERAVALDEPADGTWKIYVDANANGDLTDDGDGAWQARRTEKRPVYGVNHYTLRASWGTPKKETATGDYGIAAYRFPDRDFLLVYREATRTGTLALGGSEYQATLIENDADGLYDKPIDDDGKPLKGGTRPVWLVLTAGEKKVQVDARAPFELDGKVYEASIAADGSQIALRPSTRAAFKPKAPERPPLLAAGVAAPDFSAVAPDGSSVTLASLKGKVVILDFWATWCGPCQASMPHLEKVWKAVREKGVAVLALCVWDEKSAYEKWIPANKEKYSFPLAFDPAGRDTPRSIASRLFKVSGIPTTYVIDAEGKVAAALLGFEGDDDRRLEEALKKLGVALE